LGAHANDPIQWCRHAPGGFRLILNCINKRTKTVEVAGYMPKNVNESFFGYLLIFTGLFGSFSDGTFSEESDIMNICKI
jgi:hypothetical protein